ncbi:MAG: hypothetical protein AB7O37_19035 [Vicinamibacteria bacterium]
MDETARRRWAAQWKAAGPALAEQRRSELRALTPSQALAAADALLTLGAAAPVSHARADHSGLVEQQRLFHAARRRA